MGMPKSVTKVSRTGNVTFVSNVDAVQYSIQELTKRALYDTAKYLRKIMLIELKQMRGMKNNKRLWNSTQYWVRSRELDLQIGFKHGTWYGVDQELGTNNQPARNILRGAVYPNIDVIRSIHAKYLSEINNIDGSTSLDELGDQFGGDYE